jgi:anthranilate phosphoribosyltransferase
VLEALGVKVDADPEVVARCVEGAGIGFMFAPRMHAAMKHAIGPRKEIGIRTVFNVLGPLTNPAGAKRQLMGVFSPHLTETLARVLGMLGSERAMVVHGSDGLDEITLTGPTHVSELRDGIVRNYDIDPKKLGFNTCSAKDLIGGDSKRNAEIILDVLGGATGPRRDVVVINAAAALMVGGKAMDMQEGIEIARSAIDKGDARKVLDKLIALSNEAVPSS